MKKILFALIILSSCSKSKSSQDQVGANNNQNNQNNLEIGLVNKKWGVWKLAIQTGGAPADDNALNNLPAYQRDDYFVFRTDHTYTLYDNLNRVPGSTTDVLDQGSWEITGNVIHFTSDFFPPSSAQISISAKTLHFVYTDGESNVKKFYQYEIIP